VGFVCGDGIYCALLLMVMRCDERRKMSRLFAKGENRKMWKENNKIRENLLLYIARSTQSSATEKVKKKRTGDERI
jgi:hypothetical protein